MKRNAPWPALTFTLLLLILLIAAGCGRKQQKSGEASTSNAPLKGISSEIVRNQSASETIELVGTIKAGTSAIISARIPGSVKQLVANEGDRVKKGQLLAVLDAQESIAAAENSLAGVEDARRAVDEAMTRKRLSDTTYERYRRLFEEQAVTRQEFEAKQAESELAAQGVIRATARLKQAQQSSRGASTVAGYTRITSPITGIITKREINIGTTVFPGQNLITVEDENNYRIELAIPESMASRVKPGTAIRIALNSRRTTVDGVISEIVPTADPVSRTYTAKAKVSLPGIRSGMFGYGSIKTGSEISIIRIPATAVFERGALTSVWVLDKEGRAKMRLIKTGRTMDNRVEILSGLTNGERIAVSGIERLSEGARVE